MYKRDRSLSRRGIILLITQYQNARNYSSVRQAALLLIVYTLAPIHLILRRLTAFDGAN